MQHVGSWYDPRAERIAGLRMFHNHSVDLVHYDSDSTELVSLAQEENKLSIARKSDGTALYGETNLMDKSAVESTTYLDKGSNLYRK